MTGRSKPYLSEQRKNKPFAIKKGTTKVFSVGDLVWYRNRWREETMKEWGVGMVTKIYKHDPHAVYRVCWQNTPHEIEPHCYEYQLEKVTSDA